MARSPKPAKKYRDKVRARARRSKNTIDLVKYRDGLEDLEFATSIQHLCAANYLHVDGDASIEALLENPEARIYSNAGPVLAMFDSFKPFWVDAEYIQIEGEEERTTYIAAHYLAQEQGHPDYVDVDKGYWNMTYAVAVVHFYDLDNPRKSNGNQNVVWFHPNPAERERLQQEYDKQRADPANPFYGLP